MHRGPLILSRSAPRSHRGTLVLFRAPLLSRPSPPVSHTPHPHSPSLARRSARCASTNGDSPQRLADVARRLGHSCSPFSECLTAFEALSTAFVNVSRALGDFSRCGAHFLDSDGGFPHLGKHFPGDKSPTAPYMDAVGFYKQTVSSCPAFSRERELRAIHRDHLSL